jgi:putative oxidoreductase
MLAYAEAVLGSRPGLPAQAALVARLAAGGVFMATGVAKFTHHAREVDSFRKYGLPDPEVLSYAIGVVELGGALLLLSGLLVRPAALMLAGNMVGAISTGGVKDGGWINLGLAPAMLATMLFLLWTGPGVLAVDRLVLRRFARRLGGPSPTG